MYDNINEIIIESSDKTHPSYEFKDEPIQLVYIEDGMIEPTTDAINMLTALKDQKISVLSINGPLSSGKSSLANKILNKNMTGFKSGEKTQGIWIWGNPIKLENGTKLLVLDFQGLNKNDDENISHKLFILSVLLSTCLIYNTSGELNDSIINDFVYYTDLTNKINLYADKNDKLNNIDNLKEYFPELIFINDKSDKDSIKDTIEKNPLCDKVLKLFEKRDYINSQNIDELIEKIQKEIKFKVLDNNIIDGDDLFGLLQNFIDFMNDGETPIIHSALENVLLSKAKNQSEGILEEFRTSFNKKITYPMSITTIYKIYFELQQKAIGDFCKKVDKIISPVQTGEYMPSNVPIAASGLFAAKKQAQALQNQNALLIDRIGQAKQQTANQRAQSSNIDSNKFLPSFRKYRTTLKTMSNEIHKLSTKYQSPIVDSKDQIKTDTGSSIDEDTDEILY